MVALETKLCCRLTEIFESRLEEKSLLGSGIDHIELSQAQLNQTQAQIEQASAKYDYQTQISLLNFEVGALH